MSQKEGNANKRIPNQLQTRYKGFFIKGELTDHNGEQEWKPASRGGKQEGREWADPWAFWYPNPLPTWFSLQRPLAKGGSPSPPFDLNKSSKPNAILYTKRTEIKYKIIITTSIKILSKKHMLNVSIIILS